MSLSSYLAQVWFGRLTAIHLTLNGSSREIYWVDFVFKMTTEVRNWAVVAAAMEAQGAINSQMYRRAKALAEGKPDPMPTSHPAAPLSISAA